MEVHFEKPLNGSFQLTIQHGGKVFTDYISNFPNDFINELMPMITRIWNGESTVCITYLIGSPYGLVQWLDNSNFRIGLSYDNTPIPCTTINSKTLIEFTVTAKDLCIAFWRGLRDLEAKTAPEEFADHWGGEFPSNSLQILTDLIKQDKDKS